MLFKFKSQAASDLIMLEADARRLLKIILGNDPDQGIVQSADLPAAIAALEAAVALDELDAKEQAQTAPSATEQDDHATAPVQAVSLAQRAAPMLKMFRRSQAQGADVVWGV